MVFFVVLLLPCISLMHIVVIYIRFKYVQDFDKKYIVKGDTVNFNVKFSNEDFIPYPYLTAVFKGENSFFPVRGEIRKFSLAPYSGKTFTYEFKCMYRGSFEVGLEKLEIMDILGLFKLKYRIKSSRNLVVHPRIIQIENIHMKEGYLYDSQNMLETKHEDMAMVSNIRKYAYGDVFKKIHWKLTAKMDDIMVKDFKNTYETSAVVILDLSRNNHTPSINMEIEDRVIETTVSIINYCLSKWIPVELVYYMNGMHKMIGNSPLDFDEIYTCLAEIKFNGDVSVSDLLELFLKNNTETTNLFVVTPNINYPLVDSLYAAELLGYEVHLVLTLSARFA
jgi:hypothetical protein